MEVQFTAEQHEQLVQIASQFGIVPEKVVTTVVARYLDKETRFLAAVEKGLEAARRGDFVEEEEMEARLGGKVDMESQVPTRTAGRPERVQNVCPECGYQFRGNGFDGIDAHWRRNHEAIMPYREAWPLVRAGKYPKRPSYTSPTEANHMVEQFAPLRGLNLDFERERA